jgi:hypothetical protein
MKRLFGIILILTLLLTFLFPIMASADDVGDGNMNNGGGGMGNGSSQSFWDTGDEGVRVTVIRSSDHSVVSTPIDMTNIKPGSTIAHFGKVCKIRYTNGAGLTPKMNGYTYVNPSVPLPQIIGTSGGNANLAAIKSYFTDERVIQYIASLTGFNYNTLINGTYKLLIEPIAYFTFDGVKMGMTATEAALYDEQLGGGLRSEMASLTEKNLPLAIFLETSDLGYPAWTGSKTDRISDSDIISSLGLGIVRFGAPEQPVQIGTGDYTYRVNTEVITSVTVRGGQADPDNPVSVKFNIGGKIITVDNIYYPNGDSQLVWVRWTTPSAPQNMTITVSATGGGTVSNGTIHANIVDLPQSDPPNPTANDRNNSYLRTSAPNNPQVTSASWGIWTPSWYSNWVWDSAAGIWQDHGWWQYNYNSYSATLSASMNVTPDSKDPTTSGKVMKSGYGINESVSVGISTNDSSAVTGAQTAITYFPEFQYKTYWRILDETTGGLGAVFEFPKNRYSTYNGRSHFTPVWMPDGSYTPYTYMQDCWTPVGMLSANLTDSVTISGNVWDDWHIAPVLP